MISKLPDESEQVIAVSYINRAYERENTPVQEGKREDTPVQEGKNGSVEGEPSLSNRYIAKAQEETINGILKGENRSVESANNDLSKSIPNDGKVNEDEDIPDGGWGWIVAAGGFLGQVMVNILLCCYSILYSSFLQDLGTSAVVSSWIFNLMGFTMTFSGMFLRALVVEFGFRNTAYIGAIFMVIGTVTTAFATSPWLLMIFYSFVAGLGNGITATLTYAIVPYYFKRRLGLANAIMSSGVSAGQFIGPPLITFLQSQYGFKGSILVLTAIFLNCCAGAAVFHPREWHGKRPRLLPSKSKDGPRGLDLAVRIMKTTIGNFRLMKSLTSVMIAFGAVFNLTGYLNFLMLVPFAMQEAGFSVQNAASSVAVAGIPNLALRLIISVSADYSWFNMRLAYMAGTLIVVVLSAVYCFLTDLTTMAVVMGFWGCGVGIFMGLFNLVMVKYLGVENLMAQLGMTNFVASLWFLASGPVFGLIRDATGSYKYSILTLSFTMSITFVLYLFLPAAEAYEKRKEEKLKLEKDSQS